MFDYHRLVMHDVSFANWARTARLQVDREPAGAVMNVGLFAEAIAKQMGKKGGVRQERVGAAQLLGQLRRGGLIPPEILESFDRVRNARNRVAHGSPTTIAEAREILKHADRIAAWYIGTRTKKPVVRPTRLGATAARGQTAAERLRDRLSGSKRR